MSRYTSNTIKIAPEHEQLITFPWLDETADLNKPHHPDTSGGKAFVQYTEFHLQMELQHNLKGCPAFLWKWILLKAPAGCAVNLSWKDFQSFSGEFRSRPYSMKQIGRAVAALTELGFLEVVDANMKVVARHPGKVVNTEPRTKVSKNQTFSSKSGTKMSKPSTKMSTATAETITPPASHVAPDHTETLKSAEQEKAAAAFKVVLEEEVEQTGIEVVESGLQEVPRPEEEIGQPSQDTNEGKCSAAQLEILKKLGIAVSRALEDYLKDITVTTFDKAIACFQQDRATWEGPPMENPAGYFRTVLRQVIEGREPSPGLNHRTLAVDPIMEMLHIWRKRWENLPRQREQFRREIAEAYPNGEIVVIDDAVGPQRGGE